MEKKNIITINGKDFELVNYTPHTINLINDIDEIITIPSAGIARVAQKDIILECLNGFMIYKTVYGEVEGLPKEFKDEDKIYIVSGLVYEKLQATNVAAVTKLKRDENGRVVGAEGIKIKLFEKLYSFVKEDRTV